MVRKRKLIPEEIRIKVWQRDYWSCRYCGLPVFYAPSLKKLQSTNRNHGYFHPNGKKNKILDLFRLQWASVDHIIPSSFGGKDLLDNYVTACWSCNNKYKDKKVGKGKPKPIPVNRNAKTVNWDGFYGLFKSLKK